ncbi:hypothetical protein [Paraclostridium sp. AKS73]|uniref:hypothetical protein n=1 Tax=Paraclostridium sp. AKS73 TaxID=2876116 RepID=UPI0021E0C750|nr:hypothetical protein [Paraclostridium sp. AKS73]MCU9815374.1 hypothetical protein [Paraclostridium sp. AKS73]
MNDFLVNINSDIKRCEEIIMSNNYLEIVIAIEELTDKYKDSVDDIEPSNDRVWNFTKKDLEFLMSKLEIKRDEILNKYIDKHINVDKLISSINENIENNSSLNNEDKLDAAKVLDEIKKIHSENLNKIFDLGENEKIYKVEFDSRRNYRNEYI